MDEVWLQVVGFPGYEVSSLGRVRGHRGLMKQFDHHGYAKLTLRRDGKTYARLVHNLVAEAFIGPRPDGFQVCHFDCDRRNNRAPNLRYDTQRNNVEDSIRLGRVVAWLSDDAVRDIKENGKAYWGAAGDMARKYSVSTWTISAILNGRAWKHVT